MKYFMFIRSAAYTHLLRTEVKIHGDLRRCYLPHKTAGSIMSMQYTNKH